MNETFVSKDFLSKENTTYLYKNIITANKLDNIPKQDKEKIINQLCESMKKTFKTLELAKINTNNLNLVKKQFNDLCIKDVNIFIASKKNIVNIKQVVKNQEPVEDINHDRKFNRDFNTIKKPVTVSDRPSSSINTTSHNMTGSINDRLKELEDSRRNENNKLPPTVPDFLKPVKVGKVSQSYEVPSINNQNNKKPLLGYGEEDESNFKSSNKTNYNENMSVQERLALIESERKLPLNNMQSNQAPLNPNISSLFNQSIDQSSQFQPPPSQQFQPPPSQQFQPPPSQQFQPPPSQQFQPPPSQQFQPPPQQFQPPPSQQFQPPPSQQFQPPPPQQFQPPPQQFQPPSQQFQPPSQQFQPPPQQFQPPPQQFQMETFQQQNKINELYETIEFMKQEIMNLKNNKKTTVKSLQLEINKSDSSYKYMFNRLDNIVSINLVSYYLPVPYYNIIKDTVFNYSVQELIRHDSSSINNTSDTSMNIEKSNLDSHSTYTLNPDIPQFNIIKKSILIKQGFYNIDKLIDILNMNDDLLFSTDTSMKININIKNTNNNFNIIINKLSEKLGFINNNINFSKTLVADKLVDLRIPTKLFMYILNLQDVPVGILNFNGNSICNLVFDTPISLNELNILFTTEDKEEYNFNNIMYNLSFKIDIMN